MLEPVPRIFCQQGQRALRKVLGVVGEVRVHASDNGIMAAAAIRTERHLTQDEVANLLQSILRDKVGSCHKVAQRLGHRYTVILQEPVYRNALRQRQLCRLEERGPIDGVELRNIFADDVHICRPVLLERI